MAALADALLETARATGELPKGAPAYGTSAEAISMARMHARQIAHLQQVTSNTDEADVRRLKAVFSNAIKAVTALLDGPSMEGRMDQARVLLNREIEDARRSHAEE
jgi:hypothetical protein